MSINQTEKDNLYKGLGLFLEGFRAYIISLLMQNSGDAWADAFKDTLSVQQRENWEREIENGIAPENMIDFHHFKSFAIGNKDLPFKAILN